jgi:peptidoglycan/xylan/chitin deacetylase (PgdA/CDA1 family)
MLATLRHSARRTAARAAARLADGRLLRMAAARGCRGLAITYHEMRGEVLAGQLDYLGRFFEFVSAAELLSRASHETAGAGRLPATLTFDDGKRSNLTEVAVLLKARGIPATFFVTTEPARSGGLHWFDLANRIRRALEERRARGEANAELEAPLRALASRVGAPESEVRSLRVLKRTDAAERSALLEALAGALALDAVPRNDDERSVSPSEAAELARMGFDVGSHSCTHPIMTRESPERARREIVESCRQLSEWLGTPVRDFAYPNGNASDETERFTREAGCERAWTTRPTFLGHRENPHRLPRIELVPGYDRADIALKLWVGLFRGLPNPDGTGYAYRRAA